MADKRAYFKLDVGYLTNPKVATVLIESPTAVILHIECIAYAAQHFTDGVVPLALMLRLTGATQDDADLLVKHGLIVDRGSGEVEVHDYLEHQRSAAEAKGASVVAQNAANTRWHGSKGARRIPTGDAGRIAPSTASSTTGGMPREREEREREELLLPADAASETPSKPSRKRPARPLPETWAPSARAIEVAMAKGVDVGSQAMRFRNHAATHDRRVSNWDAAFLNWLDKAEADPRATRPEPVSSWDRQYARGPQ